VDSLSLLGPISHRGDTEIRRDGAGESYIFQTKNASHQSTRFRVFESPYLHISASFSNSAGKAAGPEKAVDSNQGKNEKKIFPKTGTMSRSQPIASAQGQMEGRDDSDGIFASI